jgi:polar amino acid transport system substrate-binding protein
MLPNSTMSRRGLLGLAGGAMVLAAIRPAQAETTLERARREGYIRVGFANEAPYGYATPDGKLTGESPEVAKAVLAKLGIKQVDGVLTEFGSLIPGLEAGRFDIIAAGMFITPKRCAQVRFSDPSYAIGAALLVKQGNPDHIADYASIAADKKLKVAVMGGAVEMGYAKESGVALSQLVVLPDQMSLVKAVQTGRADAAGLTALSIADMARKNEGVQSTAPFDTVAGKSVVGYGGFAFRKEDKELADAFNAELDKFIGTPEHIALVTPFGFGKGFLPDKKAEQICKGE